MQAFLMSEVLISKQFSTVKVKAVLTVSLATALACVAALGGSVVCSSTARLAFLAKVSILMLNTTWHQIC